MYSNDTALRIDREVKAMLGELHCEVIRLRALLAEKEVDIAGLEAELAKANALRQEFESAGLSD